MNAAELIDEVGREGVRIQLQGRDQIKVLAPKGVLTDQLIGRIKPLKQDIIRHLNQYRTQVYLYRLKGVPGWLYMISPARTLEEAEKRLRLRFMDSFIEIRRRGDERLAQHAAGPS